MIIKVKYDEGFSVFCPFLIQVIFLPLLHLAHFQYFLEQSLGLPQACESCSGPSVLPPLMIYLENSNAPSAGMGGRASK